MRSNVIPFTANAFWGGDDIKQVFGRLTRLCASSKMTTAPFSSMLCARRLCGERGKSEGCLSPRKSLNAQDCSQQRLREDRVWPLTFREEKPSFLWLYLWINQVVVRHKDDVCFLFQGAGEVVRTDPAHKHRDTLVNILTNPGGRTRLSSLGQLNWTEWSYFTPIQEASSLLRKLPRTLCSFHSFFNRVSQLETSQGCPTRRLAQREKSRP